MRRITYLSVVAGAAMLAFMESIAVAETPPIAESHANVRTIYGHVGSGSDETTGGIGYLWTSQDYALGFDLSFEGKQEDRTGGRTTIEDSFSLNVLIGAPLFNSEAYHLVPFALIGMRNYKTTCPTGQSYLGFRCYADYAPETHWRVNYGAGMVMRLDRLSIGIRATKESVSGMLGYNF